MGPAKGFGGGAWNVWTLRCEKRSLRRGWRSGGRGMERKKGFKAGSVDQGGVCSYTQTAVTSGMHGGPQRQWDCWTL